MKMINTKSHGVLDYALCGVLILLPWIFGFSNFGITRNVPLIIGISMLVYNVFTDYETGLVKIMSMRTHLMFDFLAGLSLAASPWLFDFSDYVYIPHLGFGIAAMGISISTAPAHRVFERTGIHAGPEN